MRLPSPTAVLAALRRADWLDGARARRWATILLACLAVAAVAWLVTAHDLIDAAGRPLGTDFLSFYAAARLALVGLPALAWDPAAHAAAETAVFGRELGYWAFFYPPPFLVLVLPLGLVPYGTALLVWIGATTAAALTVLRRLAPTVPAVALLAAPALWLNAGHGQNGALTLALLVGGLLLADRRPLIAGLLLGCLVVKPHLALVLPVAVLAAGRWRVAAGGALAATALAALSFVAFGAETWRAFLAAGPLARAALEDDLVGAHKMVSVFAAVRLLGGPVALAYAAQAVAAVAALAAVAVTVRRHRPAAPALVAITAAATPLVSPFLLDYDLTMLLPPLAWLAAAGARRGFRAWEKLVLLAAYLWPLLGRSVAAGLHLPLAPLLAAAVLALVLGAAAREENAPAPG
jgi:hypothetical protein